MARRERGTTDQARRIRRLKKRLYELKSLLEVTRDITSALDEETVLKLFLRSCISMVQAESAAVFRYEPVTGRLRLVDERNLPDPKTRPTAVLSADEVDSRGPGGARGRRASPRSARSQQRATSRASRARGSPRGKSKRWCRSWRAADYGA
jgi:hypothetical protein